MPFSINERDAPSGELKGGRGLSYRLINPGTGSKYLDFHINVIEPNTGPGPYHYHSNAENLYFILEGRARVIVDGEVSIAGPGDALWIPAGEKHDVTNIGDGPLRLIEVKTPPDSDFIIVPHPEAPAKQGA